MVDNTIATSKGLMGLIQYSPVFLQKDVHSSF